MDLPFPPTSSSRSLGVSDDRVSLPFLLNVLHLERGEALYLEPRTLHAYVKGNLIELMSASDNVLRGGPHRQEGRCA